MRSKYYTPAATISAAKRDPRGIIRDPDPTLNRLREKHRRLEIDVEHAIEPFGQEEPGRVHGPSHAREVVEWNTEQFPDLEMTIESLVAEGDMVAVRVRSAGTNRGRLGGFAPPTNKRFAADQSHWYRVADGRLCEHWATRDDLSTMLQLGLIEPPNGPPTTG